jgi:digeranylgeranylglycerophospholipid reductase
MRLAIIGAGPGGLYAALAAAKRGMRVDLFEKGRVGEGIVCGECVFDALGVMTKPGRGLLHAVTEIVLQGLETYRLPVRADRPLWMMDRTIWQRDLAEQAAARGVMIHEKERVSPGRLLEMKEAYDWVIDASGAPAITSRTYGFTGEYFRKYMLAVQVVIHGDFSTLMPAIKAGFLPELSREAMPGYYWVFPRDAETANVGVGCAATDAGGFPTNLKALLADVLTKEGLSGTTVLRKGGGFIPARILPQLLYDNVLLVGDAAGLTSPLHGGGIDLACLSGVLAVEAIAEGRQGAESYRDRLVGYLKEKLTMETLMVEKMRTLNFKAFDDLLHAATLNKAIIRTRVALRHPDLLFAAWKWLKKDVDLKISTTAG